MFTFLLCARACAVLTLSLLFLVCPNLSATKSEAASSSGVWTPLGEPGAGGRITALAISPFDESRILVGGDMLGVGLSVDGGATWGTTTGFSSWEVNDFTWHPANPDIVWAATMSGPYVSTDGGRTWSPRRTGLPAGDFPYSAPTQKVLIDRNTPQHLLAFGGNQRMLKAAGAGALHYGAVYESMDGGSTWSSLSSVGTDINILDVAASADLRTIYVAALSKGVLVSTDGGRTWNSVNQGLPAAAVRGVAVDPARPETVWAAVDRSASPVGGVYSPGGIFKTTDAGQTWTRSSMGLPQNSDGNPSLAAATYSVYRAADGSLYTANQGWSKPGRYVSTDGGSSWASVSASFDRFYPAGPVPYVWSATADGRTVIGGSSDTLMMSVDRGRTWRDAGARRLPTGTWRGTGFSGLVANHVVFNPAQPGSMFLSAMDSGNLLRSEDGSSWTRPTASWDNYGGGYDVAVGGAAGTVVYTVLGQSGTFNGLGVSTNTGRTWTERAGGDLPARGSRGVSRGSVAVGSADGTVAYAVLPNGKVYKTTNTGATWSVDFCGSRAYAVAVAPDFKTVYVSTDSGLYLGDEAGHYTLQVESPAKLRRLVARPGRLLYAVGELGGGPASAGVWRFAAGRWTQVSANKWASDVAVDPRNANTIVFVTNDNPYHDTTFATGVWVSRDGGSRFVQLNNGLAITRVATVAFDPVSPERLVIGTNGRGFWETRLAASP